MPRICFKKIIQSKKKKSAEGTNEVRMAENW